MAKVKSIEVEFSVGAVISDAPFENTKPNYSRKMVVDIEDGDAVMDVQNKFMDLQKSMAMNELDLFRNRMRAEAIEQQYKKVRFYDKLGKKYPSVTSVKDWAKKFKCTEDELRQYGARGTIVHYIIDNYILVHNWLKLEDINVDIMKEPISTMVNGSLKLSIDTCSYKKFFEMFEKDFKFYVDTMELEVYNDKHLYAGRLDITGLYKDQPAVIDFKTGDFEHKQLAAYAKSDTVQAIFNPKILVVCPVGECDNKSGYSKPSISENINGEFELFLKDRAAFRERFGI